MVIIVVGAGLVMMDGSVVGHEGMRRRAARCTKQQDRHHR
ncbi:hypothetical protein [Azospirillum largimobile]